MYDFSGRVLLRRGQKYLMAGDASGCISMHDPRSFRQEHSIEVRLVSRVASLACCSLFDFMFCFVLCFHFLKICQKRSVEHDIFKFAYHFSPPRPFQVHSGALSDFDVHGTTLATVGFSSTGAGPNNQLLSERFVKVYDLRFMRGTSPIQVHIAPMFLRCLPLFSASNFLILSQQGQFQIVEPSGLATNSQISNAGTMGMSMMCLDISSNYSCIAFGDSMGKSSIS